MMSRINIYWILAGLLNLGAAVYYFYLGKDEIVEPLLASTLIKNRVSTDVYGAIVAHGTLLFLTSLFLLIKGFTKEGPRNIEGAIMIGVIQIFIILSYVGVIEMMRTFILLPFLLIPTIIFTGLGIYKEIKTPPKVVPKTWQL